ncbi:restriction endonuclease subunit S [Enterococcus faecium]|uniref:restriction endonuclease subunit S n=1 Tax=Enterococcus faecium TaxID=1352 RepID=UPI001E61115D|nr:restriction endonuclease subunit S [Enterococcus faecium]MCD4930812.1 restriction endonuclease subunit S [Enterococcus faecium]
MSNNRQPEIRFPGFTEDWEQRKLSDIADKAVDNRGKTPTISEDGNHPLLEVASLGNGAPDYSKVTKYLSDETFMAELRAYIKEGDILFSTVGSIGLVSLMDTNENAAIAQNIVAFRANEKYDSKFLYAMLSTKDNQHKAQRIVMGAVQPSIKVSQLVDVDYCVTENMEEQRKLGEYFLNLDNLITLHQRKLDLLKETKKGFLQKMFPKNGAKVPEIRFPGFTEDWEQRKLGELATIVRGASPRPIQDPKWFDTESDVGWLRIADVTEQDGRIYYLEQHISKLGQEKTRVLVEPHLLLSIAATVGKPVVNYVKTGVHDGFLIFLNAIFDREFMFQWLEMFRPKWQKYGQPGSQVNLNSELVRNQEILIPNNEEQQKIGSFFKQLDDTIALHQRELDVLKETKKGFLQKMFV